MVRPLDKEDLRRWGVLVVIGSGLTVPMERTIRGKFPNPACAYGRQKGHPAIFGEFYRALGKGAHLFQYVFGVISFDLVCGITTDEMEDGESTSWVSRKPLLRDANEIAVENEEKFTVEDASGNGLSRGHGFGESACGQCRGCATRLVRPLLLFFSLDPLHFTALCFLFFFVRPCPTLSQTSLPLFPQSSPHFLLVDNNSNPTNLLEPLPAQTLPTLTIPPALLIPLLALALIAARQQVRRTLCLSQYLSVLLIFLISPTANTTSRPQPPQARRSHSTDSTPSDKAKTRSKAKKSSIHADVIDRLDFTGVGPSNYPFRLKTFFTFLTTICIVFHHDGPFDACAPSRNRQRTKAPMYAWTSINAEDEEVAARYRDNDGQNPEAPALTYEPSYSSDVSRSPPAAANYNSYYSEPPKKKVDVIAEAWGMHEPEPYEEFFAGGGDHDGPITNGSSMREARSSGRRTREELTSRPRGSNRIPPPQPIFLGDGPDPEVQSPQPSLGSGGANIGRNRSIIQRIRKMRDSPNVPVGFDETIDTPPDGASLPTSADGGSRGCPAHGRDVIRSFRSWWP